MSYVKLSVWYMLKDVVNETSRPYDEAYHHGVYSSNKLLYEWCCQWKKANKLDGHTFQHVAFQSPITLHGTVAILNSWQNLITQPPVAIDLRNFTGTFQNRYPICQKLRWK